MMDAAASRKRPRDEEEEEVGKKQQRVLLPINNYEDEDEEEKRYEFHEGIGVFDFPWLKEGVLFFNSLEEDGDDQDKTFAPPSNSYLEDHIHESSQNLCVDGDDDDDDDDGFWSLLVDDLDPVDCIWRCVIDHPLDLGFNKG